jgi:hypothetical protein
MKKQIPIYLGWYFAGFADGEGSFNVSLKKDNEYRVRWHIEPSFNLSQRDKTVLFLFKKHLGVGKIRQRKDGVYYYEVRNYKALQEVIIPFFRKYKFLSSEKKKNFLLFQKIVNLMNQGAHITNNGMTQILKIREKLNEGRGRKRKYSLDDYNNSKKVSPETRRRTS